MENLLARSYVYLEGVDSEAFPGQTMRDVHDGNKSTEDVPKLIWNDAALI